MYMVTEAKHSPNNKFRNKRYWMGTVCQNKRHSELKDPMDNGGCFAKMLCSTS